MRKTAIILILLALSAIGISKAWLCEIDEYGSREIDLVKSAGKNVCMSCIGLSDENIFHKLFGKQKGKAE